MIFGIMEQIDKLAPSDLFVSSLDIHELLPQQEPFIMIGSICHLDRDHIVSLFTIKDDHLFVADGKLCSSGIIENVAQTCAARIGYLNRHQKDKQLGVIVSITDYELYNLPRVGDTIRTEVTLIDEMFGLLHVHATVSRGDETLAETRLKMVKMDQEK